MASGPITSRQIDGETMETVRGFIFFLGSKITGDGDCSHEIKRCLLLGRKAMTNLDSIFKSRDITLPTEVHLVIAMVFAVVMCGCESWTIKKAEWRRIDAFELWCWRRVPWIAGRSNQSILKQISPEYSLEGLMLKLKTPILWPPDAKNWLIGKYPDAGKDWSRRRRGDRGWDGWMASLTQCTWVWVGSPRWTGKPGVLQSVGSQRVRCDWATEMNWGRGVIGLLFRKYDRAEAVSAFKYRIFKIFSDCIIMMHSVSAVVAFYIE